MWSKSLAARIAIGDENPSFAPSTPGQVLAAVPPCRCQQSFGCNLKLELLPMLAVLLHKLLADCTVSCRFNDFLCHTSGMGTVDNEKVLVGNLPSKSLYEYCFYPDQQCWKVNTLPGCLPAC